MEYYAGEGCARIFFEKRINKKVGLIKKVYELEHIKKEDTIYMPIGFGGAKFKELYSRLDDMKKEGYNVVIIL